MIGPHTCKARRLVDKAATISIGHSSLSGTLSPGSTSSGRPGQSEDDLAQCMSRSVDWCEEAESGQGLGAVIKDRLLLRGPVRLPVMSL